MWIHPDILGRVECLNRGGHPQSCQVDNTDRVGNMVYDPNFGRGSKAHRHWIESNRNAAGRRQMAGRDVKDFQLGVGKIAHGKTAVVRAQVDRMHGSGFEIYEAGIRPAESCRQIERGEARAQRIHGIRPIHSTFGVA